MFKEELTESSDIKKKGKIDIFYHLPLKEHRFWQSPMGEAFVEVWSQVEKSQHITGVKKCQRLDALKRVRKRVSLCPPHLFPKVAQFSAKRHLLGCEFSYGVSESMWVSVWLPEWCRIVGKFISFLCCAVLSHSVVSDILWPHGL